MTRTNRCLLVPKLISHNLQGVSQKCYIPNFSTFTYPAQTALTIAPNQQKIQAWTWNRQKQNYLYFIEPAKFLQFSNHQRLQHFLQHNNQPLMKYMLEAMQRRQLKVEKDIIEKNILVISDTNQNKKLMNPNNSEIFITNLTQQQAKARQQQFRRRHKQIIQYQRKQRARLQKLKQKQEQIKKLKQEKKIEEQLKQEQQIKIKHSQMISTKIAQNQQKREKVKKQIQKRNKDYTDIVRSWTSNQVLYEKMENQFRKRYEALFEEEKKKIQSERLRYFHNIKVQDLKIKDHEEKYLKWKAENDAVRAAKLEEQNRIVELYEKELKKYRKSRKKNQNNYSDNLDSDLEQDENEDVQKNKYKSYSQLKQQQRQLGLQKRRKMSTYWSSFVKEQRQPKIDPKKQQQLQQLIQSFQKSKKMKKVKNQKGQYIYQQLKVSDPIIKGMEYLEYSRELGRIRKSIKRDDGQDEKSSMDDQKQKQRKSIDYLKQLRESRSLLERNASSQQKRLSFLQKSDLTFQDKLQRIEKQTFRLQQKTKISQNQLKYGKFKTSDEILQYKEEIDNNHVEILRMKLLLATNSSR